MSSFVLTAIGPPDVQLQLASSLEAAVASADGVVRDVRELPELQCLGGAACGLVVTLEDSLSPSTTLTASPRARAAELRRAVAAAAREHQLPVDLACSPAVWRQLPRLLVFDMDSTLITIEVIDELGRRHGVGAEIAAITERAMRGELDFEASLRARVARLRGLPAAVLDDVAAQLTLNDGAERLIAAVRASGGQVAVASGGFTFAADVLQQRLGLAAAFANRLELVDGVATGQVVGEVITAERKAALVQELAAAVGLRQEETAAIGDGANDRLMLAAAGFGVAFRAKPVLAGYADATIDHGGLDRVLAFLGAG